MPFLKRSKFLLPSYLSLSLLVSCGGNESSGSNEIEDSSEISEPSEAPVYVSFHNVILSSDGVNQGQSAYELISEVLGENSQETPDLYTADHTEVPHIVEDFDDDVGNHFVFIMHRDLDGNKGVYEGRQRNEIKVYGGSDDILKGYENTVFDYQWKMKINSLMEVSSNFSHFFQLKPVGGDDGTPTFTITGAERSGEDVMEIRYQVPDIDSEILASVPWETFRGKWLDIRLQVKFSDQGSLQFSVTQMSDGVELVSLGFDDIDLWIGEDESHYQRPKWGIVRSLEDWENLREDEEKVRFSDIQISVLEEVE